MGDMEVRLHGVVFGKRDMRDMVRKCEYGRCFNTC